MQTATRALLGLVLGGVCVTASCMSPRIDPRPDSWYRFAVEVERCVIEVRVPGEGFVGIKPPAHFTPTGEKWDWIAGFVYDNEDFFINVRLARFDHADAPFKNPAEFITHVAMRDFGRLPPYLEPVQIGHYTWVHRYFPPAQRDPILVVDSADNYYFPLTADYALLMETAYSEKVATKAKLHASRRAIGREVVANVRVSNNCGYYQNP